MGQNLLRTSVIGFKFLIQLYPVAWMALSETLLSQASGLFGTVTSDDFLGDISRFGYVSSTAQCYGLYFFFGRGGLDGKHSHLTLGGSMLTTRAHAKAGPRKSVN